MIINRAAALSVKIMNILRRPLVIVFNYHRVCDHTNPWEHPAIDTKTFKQQLQFILKTFNVEDLGDIINSNKEYKCPVAAITFDDGYKDFHDFALPILQERGIKTTLFLTTDAVENRKMFWWDYVGYLLWNLKTPVEVNGFGRITPDNAKRQLGDMIRYIKSIDHSKSRNIISSLALCSDLNDLDTNIDRLVMNWDHIGRIHSKGVTIGAHTHTHPIISRIPDSELEDDININISLIKKHLGYSPTFFAYPNGKFKDFSEKTPDLLKSLGISNAVTTEPRLRNITKIRNSDRYTIGRINASSSNNRFMIQASGIYSIFRRS